MRVQRLIAAGLIAVASGAAAQSGGQPDGGGWDWDELETWLDNREDPSDYDNDFDTDFEPDDILALNISRTALGKARALGFRVQELRYLRTLNFTLARLRPPGRVSAAAALAQLRENDPQGFYDQNRLYHLAGTASACPGVRCYGHRLIGWSGGCVLAPRIGMIDSAVDVGNPALAGRKVVQKRMHSGPPAPGEADHGTAVAALLVGAPDSAFPGLLPQAELIAADVFARGQGGVLSTDAARLATGLDWVASHAPAVINTSITGPDGAVLRVAVRRLLSAGIALVAAAGNFGPKAPAQYPAAYPGVVAVTAVDRDLTVYAKANRGSYVTVAAPGVGIWTPGERGVGIFREGTSFAAPYATAALALLRLRDPELAPDGLLQQLRGAARDLGPPGADPIYGSGLVQSRRCQR